MKKEANSQITGYHEQKDQQNIGNNGFHKDNPKVKKNIKIDTIIANAMQKSNIIDEQLDNVIMACFRKKLLNKAKTRLICRLILCNPAATTKEIFDTICVVQPTLASNNEEMATLLIYINYVRKRVKKLFAEDIVNIESSQVDDHKMTLSFTFNLPRIKKLKSPRQRAPVRPKKTKE